MHKTDNTFTIVHRIQGQESTTVRTGLTKAEAKSWLQQKAAQQKQALSDDLIVTTRGGESWSAVEAE